MMSSIPDSAAVAAKEYFLARQPILNREQGLSAYELLFRSAAGASASGVTDDLTATASLIAHASDLGMEQVVGDKLGFVNVDAAVLMSDFVQFLPRNKVVLEILETVKATPEILARVMELQKAGFHFALDDVIADNEDVQKFLPLVEIVKIDIMGMEAGALAKLARMLPGKRLLAEKVETQAEFERCLALGFEFFQGYYFARPVILSGKKIAPSELSILHLMGLLNSDAENHEIEVSIKQDVTLGINLLKLVNTPAIGAKTRIDSIAQALMILGRRQLQRWLQILLYAKPGKGSHGATPLLQLATTRGKLLELLAQKCHPQKRNMADTAFTVGIMSLMDALFNLPMTEILTQVSVADEVEDALLKRGGFYGELLKLAEAIEHLDQSLDRLLPSLDELDLSAEDLNELQLEAFDWVNKIAQQV
ncbi:EAL domain-containing protein [Massilia sp. W12]|uniref:EAL and HDOD domain-containing protein n=1 Tax=Massilia sp. W12 TaxID=3126507 RepID=UPI0030D1490B